MSDMTCMMVRRLTDQRTRWRAEQTNVLDFIELPNWLANSSDLNPWTTLFGG